MSTEKHKAKLPSIFDTDLNNFFQGFFRPINHSVPAVDIDESEQSFTLIADLPGFEKNDIELSFNHGALDISAKHSEKLEQTEKGGNIVKERHYGSFFRRLNFGEHIAEQDITAKYDNGVLEVVLPKTPHVNKSDNKITIN